MTNEQLNHKAPVPMAINPDKPHTLEVVKQHFLGQALQDALTDTREGFTWVLETGQA